MNPTPFFRWLRIRGSELNKHPMAMQYGDTNLFHVLQQRWDSPYMGVENEWRDVPITPLDGVPEVPTI